MPQIRYNWGVCTNRDMDGNGTACPKCASKEKIKILASHDFVCPECGERLQKVQAPKTFMDKYKNLLIGAGVLVVAGGIGAGIALSGGNESKPVNTPADSDTTVVNTPKPAPVPAAAPASDMPTPAPTTAPSENATTESKPQTKATSATKTPTKQNTTERESARNGYGTVNLGYGTYRGDLKNGKPHGHGIITYSTSHRIVSSKDYVAGPGDTYEGEFRDGRPASIGIWKHDGETTGVKP